MLKMLTKKNEKEPSFFCKNCDFSTYHKPNYDRHVLTIKHLSVTNANKMLIKKNEKEPEHICCCGRVYKHKPSLLRHKKACKVVPETGEVGVSELDKMDVIIKQNQEFKELLLVQNKENRILQEKILKMGETPQIIHNTNVNQFNLNFFLNETCKNAMNIQDFIQSIKFRTLSTRTRIRLALIILFTFQITY